MTAALLAIALAAAKVALPFTPVGVRAGPPAGRVVEAARGRAFLDAGARDGVSPGQELELLRNGAPAGRCRVEAVGDRSAVCAGDGLRAGDRFVMPAPPAAAPAAPPVPGPLDAAASAERRATLEAAVVARVPAKPLPAPPRRRDAEAGASAVVFHGGSVARHQGRVHGQIRGAPVGDGLRLDAEVSSILRTAGADASPLRTGDSWLLEVREAAVSSREGASSLSFSAGRVLPRRAPGAGRLDGALVGWRIGRAEVGAFGGAVPDPRTTEPSFRRATAGLFAAARHARPSLFLREEGRVAWVRTPELGSRLEAEGTASLALARVLDLEARARLGVGGEARAKGALDEARLEVGARLGGGLALTAGLRYVGLEVPDASALVAVFPGPSRRAEAAVSWTRGGWLTLRLRAAGARDVASGLERAWAGPEIQAWLFRRRLGLQASYLEESGWLSGRSLSLGASSAFFPRVRFHLRGGLFQDERDPPLPALLEVSGSGGLDWDLGPWLALRATVLVRHSVTTGSDLGGRAFVELVARQ